MKWKEYTSFLGCHGKIFRHIMFIFDCEVVWRLSPRPLIFQITWLVGLLIFIWSPKTVTLTEHSLGYWINMNFVERLSLPAKQKTSHPFHYKSWFQIHIHSRIFLTFGQPSTVVCSHISRVGRFWRAMESLECVIEVRNSKHIKRNNPERAMFVKLKAPQQWVFHYSVPEIVADFTLISLGSDSVPGWSAIIVLGWIADAV